MSLRKKKAGFAATLTMLVPTCCAAGQPSAAKALQGPTTVTIDPQVVRLPVVAGREIRFVRLRRSRGLSQQRVTNIVQDEHGFLWFGTQYGLNRYDGYHFRIFKNDPDDPTSLCGDYISSLFVDRGGRLWVGCEYELDRYDPFTEKFAHYRLAPFRLAGTAGSVQHISQDGAGILWLSTGDGLYRFDPTTGASVRFGHDDRNQSSLSSDDVKSSREDRAGTFWVATREGLDAFDRQHARVTEHVPLSESRDFSFYEDREGVFWLLYASGNGLAIFDRKTNHLTRYSFGREDLSIHPLTGVSSMLEDRNGNLWIGTFSDGLLRFDREHRRFIRYQNDPSNSDSLSENRITTLFEDREGDIWLGLGATEPVFFASEQPPFKVLPFDSHDPANLGETLVNAIYEDRSGIVWLGTTGALVRLDRHNGNLTHFAIPGNGVASDVLAIVEDASGALWIGTSGQGLYRRTATTGLLTTFRHRDDDASSLSDDTVFQLLFDHTGTLWVATGDGLDRFNSTTQTFKTFRHIAKGQSSSLYDIVEDATGTLWAGTQFSGVLRFDPAAERFVNPSAAQDQSLPGHARVAGLLIDHSAALWAGTQNGLDRYDLQTGKVTRYLEKNGLASNDVSCILEDAAGGLWMGTSSGLSRLDPQRKAFSNYSQADGLPGTDPDLTGYRACFRGADGEMFFGGFSGGVSLRPDKLPEITYVPPVVLTSFQLFGKSVPVAPGSPLKRAVDYTDQLSLAHDQNSFSFEFSALSFRNPATNRYRFKLEGLDKDWQEVASDRRYATYTTLPPGKYRFRVQGATIRGPWSDPGLAVQVMIEPAWWQTWWFRVAAGVLVLLAMATLYALRVRQLQRQFAIRERARDSERSRVARELHDTLLQSFQAVLLRFRTAHTLFSTRPEEARQILEGAIDQAREALTEGRQAVQGLRSPAADSHEFEEAIRTLAEELSGNPTHGRTVELRLNVEGTPRALRPLARDEIYRIAGEALRNAYHHAAASRIEAQIDYGERRFSIRIRDDGKGIDPQLTANAALAGHFGLRGMRERAEEIGGRFTIWSAPGSGTEVELSVPGSIAYEASAPERYAWLTGHFSKPRTNQKS